MELNNRKIVEVYLDFIYNSKVDRAIQAAKDLGYLLWQNDLGIFSLPSLERYLIERLSSEIRVYPKDSTNYSLQKKKSVNLFIATEIYSTGGHSRLLENLATFLPYQSSDLIITQELGEKTINKINSLFREVDILDPNKSESQIIEQLSSTIAEYKNVFLIIHPYDISAVLSCALSKSITPSLKIFFINHSDHTFSYGTTVSDLWFEISLHGLKLDSFRELDCSKSFLGIPIKTEGYRCELTKFEDGDTILSAGAFLKYKPKGKDSIIPLVEALLSHYKKSTMQIVGVKKFRDYWWWVIKFKYWNRLRLYSSLPHEEYLSVSKNSKLYIDSHPFPGGTAFSEQFLAGNKICTGLISTYQGYTPLEKFKFKDPFQVLEAINTYDTDDYKRMFLQIEKVHSFKNVKARFLNAINGEITSYPYHPGDQNFSFVTTDKVDKISVTIRIWNLKILWILLKKSSLNEIILFFVKKGIYKYSICSASLKRFISPS